MIVKQVCCFENHLSEQVLQRGHLQERRCYPLRPISSPQGMTRDSWLLLAQAVPVAKVKSTKHRIHEHTEFLQFNATRTHTHLMRKCSNRLDWFSAVNRWLGLYQHKEAGSYSANKAWQTGVISEKKRKHFKPLPTRRKTQTPVDTQTYPQLWLHRW